MSLRCSISGNLLLITKKLDVKNKTKKMKKLVTKKNKYPFCQPAFVTSSSNHPEISNRFSEVFEIQLKSDAPGGQDNVNLMNAKLKDAFSSAADILPTRVARQVRPWISSKTLS